VNEVCAKLQLQQPQQIRIRYHAVSMDQRKLQRASRSISMRRNGRVTEKTVVTREREQSRDARLRQ
jgi:hypothetical protein